MTVVVPWLMAGARAARDAARRRALKRRLRGGAIRLVVGSSGVFEEGWIPTNADQLNLLSEETWAGYLVPGSVDAMLAEHVWEHLTLEGGKCGARICHRYLKAGGYIRVAVPDGLHPDPVYRADIAVDGPAGGGAGGHKVVYTFRLLQEVFESAGFITKLLEYHDEAGRLHLNDWNPADGKIHRSSKFDERGAVSIILDAMK